MQESLYHRRDTRLPRVRVVIAIVMAALLVRGARAADRVKEDNEGWFQFTATGPLGGNFRLLLEAQPRIGENAENGNVAMRALILRGALGYAVLPYWTLWAGYGYTPTYNVQRDENRIWQQSLIEFPLGPVKASNRTRLEERMMEHARGTSVRVRNQIRFVYPLPQFPSWSLVAADEFFINANTVRKGPVAGVDQNRALAGIGRQVTSNLRVEFDYVNQILNGRVGAPDTLRHSGLLQVAFTW